MKVFKMVCYLYGIVLSLLAPLWSMEENQKDSLHLELRPRSVEIEEELGGLIEKHGQAASGGIFDLTKLDLDEYYALIIELSEIEGQKHRAFGYYAQIYGALKACGASGNNQSQVEFLENNPSSCLTGQKK